MGHWTSSNDMIGIYSNSTNELLSIIAVGNCIGGVEVSDNGRYVFGTSYYGGTVSRFDLENSNARTDLSVGSWATQMSRLPDGSKLLVHYNSPNSQPSSNHSLALVDISGDNFQILATLDFGRPISDGNIAYSADGQYFYVSMNSGITSGPSLFMVRLSDFSIVAQLEICEGAGIFKELSGVVRGGDYLYVSNVTDRKIHKISIDTFSIVDEATYIDTPQFIAIHPSSNYLFVAPREDNGTLRVFEADSLTEVTSLVVRANCYDIEFSSDGSTLYIAHRYNDGGVTTLQFTE